jgi:hypothetical protein
MDLRNFSRDVLKTSGGRSGIATANNDEIVVSYQGFGDRWHPKHAREHGLELTRHFLGPFL